MPNIADYFAVCGLGQDLDKEISEGRQSGLTPPLLRSFTSKLLCWFPEQQLTWNQFDESAVLTLSMPEGLLFKKNLADQLSTVYHSFLITRENGTHSYGNVLTFYEPVREAKILNMLESLQVKYLQKRHSLNSADEQHCFTRGKDTLYAPKCLCLLSSEPIHEPLRAFLEQLHSVTIGEHVTQLTIESYLYNLLYEVAMPSPGKQVNFSGPLSKLTFRRPSLRDFPLCDYSFKRFFEILGVRNIVKLLTCILLEHQVLVKSSDYEDLMLVCHISTALLFPFSWPHVFVPFLPSSQRGFLDAPVPYIMGLKVDNSTLNLPNVASLCTVDVEKGCVECPDELPLLPNQDKLVLQLSDKVQLFGVSCPDLPELPSSPPLSARKSSIIEALRVVQELTEDGENSDLKKVLTEAALNNHHVPNLINIATRAGIKTPLSPTPSLEKGTYELDNEEEAGAHLTEASQTQFASAVRDVCAAYFVEQFVNYENFIIVPTQSQEQWTLNREQFQNFDKTSFISDQPLNSHEFFSAFVESSMFTCFVDEKLVSLWEPGRTSHKLSLFESLVESYRERTGLAKPPTTPGSRNPSLSSEGVCTDSGGVDAGAELITETAPLPRPLSKGAPLHSPTTTGTFPPLNAALLKIGQRKVSALSRDCKSDSNLLPRNTPVKRPRNSNGNGLFSSQSHAKFVSQLMRESRLRVKHMLGSSSEGENVIEENTHIAYLCDLLERIWGHGLKKRDNKSSLWAHLVAYAESVGAEEFSPGMRGRVSSPGPTPLTSSMSSLAIQSTTLSTASNESPRLTLRAHLKRKKFQSPQLLSRVKFVLHPRPHTLLEDLSTVHQMSDVKTDVGRARAWVRLGLENKCLSQHLSTLLEHRELILRRYRQYAFIGTDEEREQFLYHLLTLTARDFNCFTTGFLSTTMTYRVLVVGEGKHFGLSTACLYVTLGGEGSQSVTVEIPRGEYQVDITSKNLGVLTSLRVGHDNSGITPSLFVEMVLVHNLTTGQTYRFDCGHWFARSEEDGSIERFLTAHKVRLTLAKSGAMSALDVDSVVPLSPGRKRAASMRRDTDTSSVNDIKFGLKSTMDKIRTTSLARRRDSAHELLQLIHGPTGYLSCMSQVLNFGFKNYRKFQKKLYLWDLFERVAKQLVTECNEEDQPPTQSQLPTQAQPPTQSQLPTQAQPPTHSQPPTQAQHMFLNAVNRITVNNTNIGKDEKAMQLLSLGLRDHYIREWVWLLSRSPVTATLYEPVSFLLDQELLQNLLDALALTMSLNIRLEPLFTQGL